MSARNGNSVLALAAAIALSGCCSRNFKLEDMEAKNLFTPFDTLDYFRYALRTENWGAVYECLSKNDKDYLEEKHGLKPTFVDLMAFGRVLKRRTIEDFAPHAPDEVREMPLVDLIHRAETWNVVVEPPDPKTGLARKGIAIAYLYYKPYGSVEPFVLVEEPDAGGKKRWRVDIQRWLEERER